MTPNFTYLRSNSSFPFAQIPESAHFHLWMWMWCAGADWKVAPHRRCHAVEIDTDVMRSSTLLGRRGWLRRESIKGRDGRGEEVGAGGLLSFVFILTQRKVKKAACDWREDWCGKQPPPLRVRRSGNPQREQRLILSPDGDKACFSHRVIWDYEGYCAGPVRLYWCRWQDGDVGIGSTDWSWGKKKKKKMERQRLARCCCLVPPIPGREAAL